MDLFKTLIWWSDLLNQSLNWFIQNTGEFRNWANESLWVSHWIIYSANLFKYTDWFRKWTRDCLNEWVTDDSLNGFVQNIDLFKWLFISGFSYLTDLCKTVIHSGTKQVSLYQWVRESLTKPINSKHRFIQEQIKWLSL